MKKFLQKLTLDHYRKICLSQCKKLTQDFKKEVDKVKKDFTDLGDSIKRDL